MPDASARKYQHMLRAYERLRTINTDNGPRITTTDAADATEDFFNQCHHLKDYLKKDPSGAFKDVEDWIKATPCMRIAAVYCNSLKHAGPKNTPRSGNHIEKTNTHTKLTVTPRRATTSSAQSITIGGKTYDAPQLAAECVAAWDAYLAQCGVDFRHA